MKITTFVSGCSLTEELSRHIDRHVRFALRNIDVEIDRVRVRILEHEPAGVVLDRGDPESICRIQVEFRSIKSLIVEETGECPSISASRSAQRLSQLVAAHVALTEKRAPKRTATQTAETTSVA